MLRALPVLHGPCAMEPTHTQENTHFVKCNENWAFEGDTSKSLWNANTGKAGMFHKSPGERKLVRVYVCVRRS